MAAVDEGEEARNYRVGCALLPKKTKRYLTPAVLAAAAAVGVELQLIDRSRPLGEQGRFDAILHKLGPDKGWEGVLRSYLESHPATRAIDRPECIRTLQNRGTMLRPLTQGGGLLVQQGQEQQQQEQQQRDASSAHTREGKRRRHGEEAMPQEQGQQEREQQAAAGGGGGRGGPAAALVRAPRQVEIPEGAAEADVRAALASAGLAPPLLCKPLWADGREGSHGLAVLHDLGGLAGLLAGGAGPELRPPLVVQQYVEHGGALFKVYVMGGQTALVRRPSLSVPQLGGGAGVQRLPRVSCSGALARHAAAAAAAAAADGGGEGAQPAAAAVATPPEWVTRAAAAALRERLGVSLFNFDMICPQEHAHSEGGLAGEGGGGGGDGGGEAAARGPLSYLIVDINYWPGIDKLPSFEGRFAEFLRSACEGEPPLPAGGGSWADIDAAWGAPSEAAGGSWADIDAAWGAPSEAAGGGCELAGEQRRQQQNGSAQQQPRQQQQQQQDTACR
ncbi:MAG: inositol 1, 3, 4-trisphosphate 5/6-kinase-domain-containing protein [Monoraphidium minutum]|nr:MAG: inositol 1, 3, 4-trisphosphate 5/6-kinase-domain-containing protein [Monoraphidium minutum]